MSDDNQCVISGLFTFQDDSGAVRQERYKIMFFLGGVKVDLCCSAHSL